MSTYRDDEPSRVFGRGGRSRPLPGQGGPGQGQGGPGQGPRDHSVDDSALEEIDDFQPPNPKNPLAGAKPAVVLGAVLSIGAILALIIVPFLPLNAPGWTVPALIGVVLAGLVILFLQMPRSRTGSGDGAQV
ncbi:MULTISPECIES: hypothetical protein [unclassified Nesterenkonia]|uniref:hypothetical protein n=1 Tax=unclassified Nesterenkonia TaxID=2629769 RepID=UPI001F4D1B3C|nr:MULTISPECIES: hypothetical protein [unclassified Nesterenkonia]MCH8559543.1 hypothetical protein [Nesterenkonia sp. DZ6]MCH8561720.1 hypothetical protein [Nesterenkonia sp. YGD6]MCH8570381.1 hypothetical protein [Nesterenkonia sp. AY15]